MLYSREFAVSSDLYNILKRVHVVCRTVCKRESQNFRLSSITHSLLVLYTYLELPVITNNAFTEQAILEITLWTSSLEALIIVHDIGCPEFFVVFLKFVQVNAGIVP
jgi:hypothetical protein